MLVRDQLKRSTFQTRARACALLVTLRLFKDPPNIPRGLPFVVQVILKEFIGARRVLGAVRRSVEGPWAGCVTV